MATTLKSRRRSEDPRQGLFDAAELDLAHFSGPPFPPAELRVTQHPRGLGCGNGDRLYDGITLFV